MPSKIDCNHVIESQYLNMYERNLKPNEHLSLVISPIFSPFRSQLPVIFLASVSCLIFSSMLNMYQPTYALPDFNFAAVGDWGCNSNTDATVTNIRGKNPELVLGLGDYSYQPTANCWFTKIQPIDSITKINIGNHEDQVSEGFNQYMAHFGLTQPYYSYDYQNVHILTMTYQSAYTTGSAQYDFVVNDLQTSSQDPSIDWIIISFHDWVYRSSSSNPHNDDFAEVYHPLFDQYDVDLVLSGHDHSYHRTYPIKFNPSNPTNPIITSNNPQDYIDPQGQVYAVVGTGGINLGPITGSSPFVSSAQDDFFGQLDLKFTNNGAKLEGKMYRNGNNAILDSFSITKTDAQGQGNYIYSPGIVLTGSNYNDTPSTSSLQLSQFSLAAWFKTSTNFGSDSYIVNKGGVGSDSAGQNMNYGIWMTSSEQLKAGFETSSGADQFVTSTNTYNDGQWHYAVVVNDGSNLRLYVDGVQVATKSTSGASPESSGVKPIRVGANSRVTPPGNFFTGEVDEVRVWNDDLTAQQVSDAFEGTSFNTAEQVLHLPFGSSPPVANNQAINTFKNAAKPITLTATDPDSTMLNYTVVTPTENGTLSGTAPNLTYNPDTDFVGADSFTFKANDGTTDSNIATVSITVSEPSPPVANNQDVIVTKNVAKPITLTATDPDSTMLNYTVVTPTENGTLSGTAPNLTYNPDTDFVGADSFTFKANDGTTDSNIATVNITVQEPAQTGGYHYSPSFVLTGSNYNDTPNAANLQLNQFSVAAWFKTSTNFGSDSYIVNKGGVGSDSAGQNMNYGIWMTSSEQLKAGFETSNGADQFVTSASTYSDGQWHYAVVTNDGSNLILYIDGAQAATKSTSGASPESSGVKPVRVGANSRVTPPGNFFTGEVDEVRVWNDDLTAQQAGNAFAGTDFTDTKKVLHLPFGGNSPPVANNRAVNVIKNTQTPITLTATDPDNNPLTYSIVALPLHGTVAPPGPGTASRTYTPTTNYLGPDSFTFKANDGTVDSNVATVSITVAEQPQGGYNYAPSLALAGTNYHDEPDNANLRLTQFTVAAWFKTSTNFASESFIVNKGGIGSDSAGQNQNYQISMASTEQIKVGFETSTGADQFLTSPLTYSDGQWHYAVVTNDGSTLTLYIDGAAVTSKSVAGSSPENTGTKPVRVGANSRVTPPGNFFTGEVDEIRVWNDDLTAQQVSDAFAGTSFNTAGQVLYLDFSSSSATGYHFDPSLSLSGPS